MYNRQISNALKAAKNYLARSESGCNKSDSKQLFICWALRSALDSRDITQAQFSFAKHLIHKRLNGRIMFEDWLRSCDGFDAKLLDNDEKHNDSRKLQATRHAWLNSLIREFNKPGVFKS